jgi:CheY-like chemotaxis protein
MGPRVLVVEDSPTMRSFVATALEAAGIVDVTEASSGFAALQKVTAHNTHGSRKTTVLPGLLQQVKMTVMKWVKFCYNTQDSHYIYSFAI